jgi:hypothetical protein
MVACFCKKEIMFALSKAANLKEVNCTEPSLSVRVPWYDTDKHSHQCIEITVYT